MASIEDKFIDEETISNMLELGVGDGEFSNSYLIVQLMSVFLESLPERLAQLKEGELNNNVSIIGAVAHTLKSSSKIIGLITIADELQTLEDLSSSRKHAEAIQLLKKVELQLKKAVIEIKNKMKELGDHYKSQTQMLE